MTLAQAISTCVAIAETFPSSTDRAALAAVLEVAKVENRIRTEFSEILSGGDENTMLHVSARDQQGVIVCGAFWPHENGMDMTTGDYWRDYAQVAFRSVQHALAKGTGQQQAAILAPEHVNAILDAATGALYERNNRLG